MAVGTPIQPDFETMGSSPTAYKEAIEGCVMAFMRLAGAFAPHEQSTPNMTVRLEAGYIFEGGALTEVAAQSTPTIAAPATNPQIDRVVVDWATGARSVVTGTPAAVPSAPAIPSGRVPICQVYLTPGMTAITNADITDERVSHGAGNNADTPQIYTTAGDHSYVVPAGRTSAQVMMLGAGGGGGGRGNTGLYKSSGGGSGALVHGFVTGLTPGDTIPVYIGAAGLGGVGAAAGAAGEDSTFETYLTAKGGAGGATNGTGAIAAGGAYAAPGAGAYLTHSVNAGCISPSSGADLHSQLDAEGDADGNATGAGGRNAFGSTRVPVATNATGTTATAPGAGGSGVNRTSGGPYNGGAGKLGYMIVIPMP
jgi:hypothetical protein